MTPDEIAALEAEADELSAVHMTADALKYARSVARQKFARGWATPFDLAWLDAIAATLDEFDPERLADALLRAVEGWSIE